MNCIEGSNPSDSAKIEPQVIRHLGFFLFWRSYLDPAVGRPGAWL